jgi:PAS domain S-box-containing protein
MFDYEDEPPIEGLYTPTETIDLKNLLPDDLTQSGSFDLSWLKFSPFGKLLRVLPIPALLIDKTLSIRFLNSAWTKVSPNYMKVEGEPFSVLFLAEKIKEEMDQTVKSVLASRKSSVREAIVDIEGKKMWGRFSFQSIRCGDMRMLLVLIEDLTHEKKQVLLTKKFQQELSSRNDLLRKEMKEKEVITEALRSSEEKYRMIFDNSPIGILHFDLDGNITACNEMFLRICDMKKEQIIGVNLISQVTNQELLLAINESFLGGRGHFEGDLALPGAEKLLYVKCDFGPLFSSDNYIVGGTGIVEDIADQKHAADLLLQSEKLQAVAELASGVAHNFNNLLQVVVGGAQLAALNIDLGNYKKALEGLDQILESSKFGAETVRRLQGFAKLRSKDSETPTQVFDVSETVKQAVEMTKPLWKAGSEKSGIAIVMRVKTTPGCNVRGYESELFEVLVNLIKNATEAMPDGGHIDIATSVDEVKERVYLVVSDEGTGIREEDLKNVFTPFWTTKGVQGTGIGLASAYGTIVKHKGTISVENKPRGGVSFLIELPLSEELSTATGIFGDEVLVGHYTILIVDDMEPILMTLKEGLKLYGHEVFTASNGAAAIETFLQNNIDIVICDLAMPGMNGWQVGKSIRELSGSEKREKPLFILLTGWGGQVKEPELSDCGVDLVLEKPVNIKAVLRAINKLETVKVPSLFDNLSFP